MAELKTRQNDSSVEAFLASIADARKRADSLTLLELMREVTMSEPKMWGDTIVGFGAYHYQYASGREGDWFVAGFSPRKQNLTLYSASGFARHEDLLQRLGKHKLGKGCLYINKLADVDVAVLRELVAQAATVTPAEEDA